MVVIVIEGIENVEVALGNAVPEVCPAVGMAPSLLETFHAKAVSSSTTPLTADGGAMVGMVKNVSVSPFSVIRVKVGAGSRNTSGVHFATYSIDPPLEPAAISPVQVAAA